MLHDVTDDWRATVRVFKETAQTFGQHVIESLRRPIVGANLPQENLHSDENVVLKLS